MSYSLIPTCRVRYKLKLLIRIQFLCKSGPVVLRLKMHYNNLKPNSPFSAHSGRSLQICSQWGAKEIHWKTVHRPFPAPCCVDKVHFKKLTGLWVTEKAEIYWGFPRQIQPSALRRAEGVAASQPKLKV